MREFFSLFFFFLSRWNRDSMLTLSVLKRKCLPATSCKIECRRCIDLTIKQNTIIKRGMLILREIYSWLIVGIVKINEMRVREQDQLPSPFDVNVKAPMLRSLNYG